MKRPALAVRRSDGGVWTTSGGLGWTNPYDERVWKYNVDIAEAAARAGFDEIMFDYVRFPSDGDLAAMVFNHQVKEPKAETIVRFVNTPATGCTRSACESPQRCSGSAATRDLGIGQRPRKLGSYLDAIYPMVYPSHYSPGRVQHRQSGRRIPAGRLRSRFETSARSFAAGRRRLFPGSRTSRSSTPTRWPRSRPRWTQPGGRSRPATCSGTRRASTPTAPWRRRSSNLPQVYAQAPPRTCGNCG